ncbi:MAG: TldD/PmbA family protein [Myxococcales bacterium]|nr:TldD/PmbA family protein [Myxococcales bacterium]
MRRFAVSGLALAAVLVCPAPARSDGDPRLAVLTAMREELARSITRLRLPGYEAPYFIAYGVREHDGRELSGKFGAVEVDRAGRSRRGYVEVRVGDYQLDNSGGTDDLPFDPDAPDAWEPETAIALDDDPTAIRASLWLLTDQRYKRALAGYAKKRGRRATTVVEDEALPSFSREAAQKAIEPAEPVRFDRAKLADRVRKAGALFKRYPEVFDAGVRIAADRTTRWLVTSEGSEIISERIIYTTVVSGATRARDGMLLEHEKAFYTATVEALPDDEALARVVAELSGELHALREAPLSDPYSGPAILMPQAAGVFFHEAVGHRLEGERQNDEKEGRTYKGQIGRRILPEFLSVHDDPTLRAAGPKREALNGYYRFDDEGVAARDVTLIEAGVLRDYLMSRTPITGSVRSNGHGRAEGTADPMGRMANLVVRSSKRVPEAQLKKMLLDEVRRQGKPFGLVIRDITGGSTNTTNYGFQAFKGQPRLVYRVDARSGAETLVRGVDLVGTPLASINKIVAASDTDGVFNGFCGAESGFVPVSTVAPAVLMTEIELQRSQRALERPPVLPPPWNDPAPRQPPGETRSTGVPASHGGVPPSLGPAQLKPVPQIAPPTP